MKTFFATQRARKPVAPDTDRGEEIQIMTPQPIPPRSRQRPRFLSQITQCPRTRCRPSALAATLLLACGGRNVDLGEDTSETNFAEDSPPPCQLSSEERVDYVVGVQPDLDALLGCTSVGDLSIDAFEGMDVRPLRYLQNVGGNLRIQGEPASPWPGPLQDLDSLQSVGSLALSSLDIPDVDGLSGLQTTLTELSVIDCPRLVTLGGLSGVVVTNALTLVDDPALISLGDGQSRGPGFARELGTLTLSGRIALQELADPAGVGPERIDTILVENTLLESLDILGSIEDASRVTIIGNEQLQDASGLLLFRADVVEISDNPVLTNVESLKFLNLRERLSILNNDSLSELPEFQTGPRELTLSFDSEAPQGRAVAARLPVPQIVFEVEGNRALQRLELPPGWERFEYISVYDNDSLLLIEGSDVVEASVLTVSRNLSLEEIALPDLRRSTRLEIVDNPNLFSVRVQELDTVNTLLVEGNGKLGTNVFDDTKVFEKHVSGNGTGFEMISQLAERAEAEEQAAGSEQD